MRSIGPLEFEKTLFSEARPVLFAYLRKNVRYRMQLDALEEACRELGDKMDVYVLNAESLTAFWERHGFKGTLTFMIFLCGREQAKLLGRATAQTLKRFILDFLGPGNAS